MPLGSNRLELLIAIDASGNQEKQQARQHCKIRTGIADDVPKALACMHEFWNLGRNNCGADDDQEGNACQTKPTADKHQQSTDDFKKTYEMRSKGRMRKSDVNRSTSIRGSVYLRMP